MQIYLRRKPQSDYFNQKFQRKIMLNIGNRIKYNNTIYRIVGINFSTYYLRADNSTSSYDYDMQDVYRQYKDFEILERNIKNTYSV